LSFPEELKTNKGLPNNTSRSVILAPFNSTLSDKDKTIEYPVFDKNLIVYSAKVREANRQYEYNNNGEVDNGILIDKEPPLQKIKPGVNSEVTAHSSPHQKLRLK